MAKTNNVQELLAGIQKEHPELLKEVTDKDRPEFRHLGYELGEKMKHLKVAVGLALWCGAWYGTGLVILNKLFPKDTK